MNDNVNYWQRVGIEKASGFRALLFNASSHTLIAHMYRCGKDNMQFSELYIREKSAENYSPLLQFEEDVSFEYPVSSPYGPFLYFVVLKARLHDGKYIGYDNIEVRKVDLFNRRIAASLGDEQLKFPSPYYRAWVSTILGLGGKEGLLYCTVGMQREEAKDHFPVDYKIGLLSLETGSIELVAELREVFI
jgi:hypothetical protein